MTVVDQDRDSPVRGKLIRQLREQMNGGHGMPRHKFAAAADISPSTLQRAEDGEPGTSLPVLTRIARTLDVPLSTIYDSTIHVDIAPAWVDQLDARMMSIEQAQAELLRLLRSKQ